MSCHGLGSTRLLAVLLHSLWDKKTLLGNKSFSVCDDVLVTWSDNHDVLNKAEGVYKRLKASGRQVVWENRFLRAGQALSASETLGASRRFVVSERTGEKIEHTLFETKETRLIDHEGDVL